MEKNAKEKPSTKTLKKKTKISKPEIQKRIDSFYIVLINN